MTTENLFKETNFSGANLYGAYFYMANLSSNNFKNANLEGTDLRGVNLSNADLTGSIIKNTKLVNTNIEGIISDDITYLILEHKFQNSLEPITESLGYSQRAINKIFDKYILNSI